MGEPRNAFVVERPDGPHDGDGEIVIEVHCDEQLTVAEALSFARLLTRQAKRALSMQRRRWPRRVLRVEDQTSSVTNGNPYRFTLNGRNVSLTAWTTARDLEDWMLRARVTHVCSALGNNAKTDEACIQDGTYTRDAYLRWWRHSEDQES